MVRVPMLLHGVPDGLLESTKNCTDFTIKKPRNAGLFLYTSSKKQPVFDKPLTFSG